MFGSTIKHARTVATLGVAAALVVGGVAVAQGGSGGGQGQSGPPKGLRMPPPGGPLGGPAGKDLTYAQLHLQRNGEAQVIRLDNGKVTAVGDTSITLEENDGSEVKIAVDESTKVLAGPGRETSVSDLETGQQVVVCGPEGGTAKTIVLPPKGGKSGQLPPPPEGSEGGPPQMQG